MSLRLNPTADELKTFIEISGLPIKKFFNTSGLLYKSMGLKDKLLLKSFLIQAVFYINQWG